MSICGISKGNQRILLLQPFEIKGVCFETCNFLRERVSLNKSSGSEIELNEVQDPQMEADEPIEPMTAELADSVVDLPIEQAPRRSTRVRIEPER